MSTAGLVFPLVGERVRLEFSGEDGGATIVGFNDGAAVGSVLFESAGSVLTIRSLCIDEPHRSYGCGSEAAWLVVRAARASGYELLRASAPAALGLAVYFWIRMGFHPLHGDGPEGGIWLERQLR